MPRYAYDPYGNLQSITYADNSVESWSYDFDGNPQTWNNRRGHQTFYTVNNNGQVTGKYFADGSATAYSYDAKGNLTNSITYDTILNPLESVSMTYDSSNHLARMDYPGGKYLTFTYDSNGRRLSSLDQLGHRLNYSYDVAGRLQSMTNELNAQVVNYQYDNAGRIVTKTVGNGMFTTYQYDPAGQLLGLTNRLANSTVISRFNYTYDSRGRRTTMNTLDGNWTYTYDDLGQLTHAVYAAITTNVPNQDLTYIYDAVGNRTRTIENGVTNSYTVNNLNEYFSVGQTNLVFDADGNLIRETWAQGTNTYTYNDENRLIGLTTPNGTWSYGYDGLANRVTKNENGVTTRYVIDPSGLGNVVGEYNQTGNLIAHYDHAFGLLAKVDIGGIFSGYTFDALGNVQQLVSSAGAIFNSYAYTPFGGSLRKVEAIPNPFQFNGQSGVAAEPSGIVFMRNRFYSSATGRFLSIDPLRQLGLDVNFYRYVQNNPVNYNDPVGLSVWWDTLKGVFGQDTPCEALAGGLGSIFIGGALAPMVVPITTAAGTWIGGFTGGALGTIVIPGAGTTVLGIAGAEIGAAAGMQTGILISGWLGDKIGSRICPTPPPAGTPPGDFPYGPIPPPFNPGGNGSGGSTGVTKPTDPNQMTGPSGYGANGYLASTKVLVYRIDFENQTNASAPAQQVIITDQLSTNFDWTTFNVSEIGFGDVIISLPPGTANYTANVPYSYLGTNFQVQIQIAINRNSGLITATFRSIDPNTSLPPPVNIGFLPPENGTGRGQGHVSYTVLAKSGVTTGTQLRNVALISFDNQPSISTDQIDPNNAAAGIDPNKQALVTIDAIAPTSHVNTLPAQSQLLQVPVSWTGQDDPSGSGVASYDIYISDNGGAWTQWLSGSTASNVTYQGKPQHTYAFKSAAHDNAGNVEAQHATADATTLIVANPQFQLTVTPVSTNLNNNTTFSYTVIVKNIGSLNLNNVTMSNAMPAGISLDWITYGRGAATIGDSGYSWSLGNMNTNVSASMNVTADTVANGTWTNFFTVADSDGAASTATTAMIYVGVQPNPILYVAASTNRQVALFWNQSGSYSLQTTTNLAPLVSWTLVTNTPIVISGTNLVTLPATNSRQFFRLTK